MTDNPPDWARVEAVRRLNAEYPGNPACWRYPEHRNSPSVIVAARLIAKHEQPPEDPDLETAREAVNRCYQTFTTGGLLPPIDAALAAIKLHKERNP